ncbi:hypothetical protein [Metapseudomonas resinovorans]|uniref:Uncharacterized protein n=1 Tax=Metapseudomonas resinovorans NBRC 106553 TaxID=1245471 RepID=S6AJ81_METRE|nr:hypothetical protein [Pseudomonas resinovorans]BAN50812.1 hypothetical protein PCA10_50800 [Pseudomonas resinovorans NBRC 106553]
MNEPTRRADAPTPNDAAGATFARLPAPILRALRWRLLFVACACATTLLLAVLSTANAAPPP